MKLEGVKNSNYNCPRVLNAQNQLISWPLTKEKICIKVRQTQQPNLISKHEISGISNDKLQLTSAQSMIVKNPDIQASKGNDRQNTRSRRRNGSVPILDHLLCKAFYNFWVYLKG